jgi:hypothetical protein
MRRFASQRQKHLWRGLPQLPSFRSMRRFASQRQNQLLTLFVGSALPLERAEFYEFYSGGMLAFVFGRFVITLFARGAF